MIALHKSELFQAAVSLLYPATCTICRKHVRAGEYLCDGCEAKIVRIVPPFCETCSEPFEGSMNTGVYAARIVRIARSISTQRSPHTAAAVSFATLSTNSNTTARSTCVILWRAGSALHSMMNGCAIASSTLSCQYMYSTSARQATAAI